MTSGRLLLFKSETIHITNLFQYCCLLSVSDLYEPCIPEICDGYMQLKFGKFLTDFVKDPDEFRYVDWEPHLERVAAILASGKNLIFGSYSLGNLDLIKKTLNCPIISYNYDSSLYDTVLERFTRVYLYRQEHGIVPITEYDEEVRASGVDLVTFYNRVFDEQSLVPKSLEPTGDYSIPIRDYFNFENFRKHFEGLNITLSCAAKQYYNQWWHEWEPIWRKYNESK